MRMPQKLPTALTKPAYQSTLEITKDQLSRTSKVPLRTQRTTRPEPEPFIKASTSGRLEKL